MTTIAAVRGACPSQCTIESGMEDTWILRSILQLLLSKVRSGGYLVARVRALPPRPPVCALPCEGMTNSRTLLVRAARCLRMYSEDVGDIMAACIQLQTRLRAQRMLSMHCVELYRLLLGRAAPVVGTAQAINAAFTMLLEQCCDVLCRHGEPVRGALLPEQARSRWHPRLCSWCGPTPLCTSLAAGSRPGYLGRNVGPIQCHLKSTTTPCHCCAPYSLYSCLLNYKRAVL